MGTRVIEGCEPGSDTPLAVLFDSVTGIVMGKRMRDADAETAYAFEAWALKRLDARDLRLVPNEVILEAQDEWEGLGRPTLEGSA